MGVSTGLIHLTSSTAVEHHRWSSDVLQSDAGLLSPLNMSLSLLIMESDLYLLIYQSLCHEEHTQTHTQHTLSWRYESTYVAPRAHTRVGREKKLARLYVHKDVLNHPQGQTYWHSEMHAIVALNHIQSG